MNYLPDGSFNLKNMENKFVRFISQTIDQEGVWLLQAMDGMFAMVESADRKSYVAVWDQKSEAEANATDEWVDYACVWMDLKEWIQWLNELTEDETWIAISPDASGKVLPIEANELLKILVAEKKNHSGA